MTLGNTPSGADWCLKALHPSDPVVEVRGLPDKSAVPSAFINYQSVFTYSPQAGATGTWTLDLSVLPDPIAMISYNATDSVGAVIGCSLNSQITGANYAGKYGALANSVQRWRLAYMSITLHQDGPDLANQGTIVVCQKPAQPAVVYGSIMNGTQAELGSKVIAYQGDDEPLYTSAQALPNSYFNQSKYGCYAPMKLTRTCQNWRSVMFDCSHPAGQSSVWLGNSVRLPAATSASTVWPYYGLNQAYALATVGIAGETVLDWGNDSNIQISCRNLAVTTSFTAFIRMGIEIQCNASSIYSPQLRLSPMYDPRAMKTYFAIARELKDAYPADYNDLAKLWDWIKQALRKVAPIISGIPHPIATVIGGAISPSLDVIEGIERAVHKSKSAPRDSPSQAVIEQARTNMATNTAPKGSALPARKKLGIQRRGGPPK